jgi:hypothetical protein
MIANYIQCFGGSIFDAGFHTPHPTYGSEFSTAGGSGESKGQWSRQPFPVSSTAPYYRRIKSESQDYFEPGRV